MIMDNDIVFKALAHRSRRKLLDALCERNGQTLGELCEHLSTSRQAVMKHLAILEAANLVTVTWAGREKLHFLNPAPIQETYGRWVGRFERHRAEALDSLKQRSRREERMIKMNNLKFLYVSYIKTTPDELWEALTGAEFTRLYWMENSVESDWKAGSSGHFQQT